MNREHALRYLLLRHMSKFRDVVEESIFNEVSNSLEVEKNEHGYTVTWSKNGDSYRKFFENENFSFYQRGDLNPDARSVRDSLTTSNDANAAAFAEGVFGIPYKAQPKPFRTDNIMSAVNITLDVFFLLAVWKLGELGPLNAFLLAPLFFLEYLPKGGLLASIYLCVVLLSRLRAGILVGGVVYAVVTQFDAEKTYRSVRTLLSAGAAAIALLFFFKAGGDSLSFSATFWLMLLLAVIISSANIFYSIHRRLFPLAFPFFSAGLALAGYEKTAWAGFIYLGVRFVLVGYGFRVIDALRSFQPKVVS